MADLFSPIHSYSDPGSDNQKFQDYELNLRISPDALSYCVFDSVAAKFLHLESYDLREPGRNPVIPGDHGQWVSTRLSELLEDKLADMAGGHQKCRILLEWGNVALVPEALYSEDEKAAIFDFNNAGGPYPVNELRHDALPGLNAYSIYHVPPAVGSLLERFFPGAGLHHHSTALINGILQKYINLGNDKLLHVNVARSRVDILRLKGKKLDYFNSFTYNTAEDFMYYLIFVVEQLGLNPESVELIISGEVDKHSSLVDLVMKYIRYVQFVKRNDDFRYSFVFDQLPGHYYYNLFNASLCE